MSAGRCMVSQIYIFILVTPSISFMILTQCVYLSTLIRNIEIGHNLNLAHSGEAATYDDQSGMVSIFQLHVCIATNLKTLNN